MKSDHGPRRNFFGPKNNGRPGAPDLTIPTLETVASLSAKLHLSEWSIYQLARRQEIPHVKIGGKILFKPAAINAWLDEHSVEGCVVEKINQLKKAKKKNNEKIHPNEQQTC